jgi:hypothetical protein
MQLRKKMIHIVWQKQTKRLHTSERFKLTVGCYFISFAVVEWVNVFTRKEYKDLLVTNLKYCQQEKGLELYYWCLMSNHIHVIVSAKENNNHLFGMFICSECSTIALFDICNVVLLSAVL